MTRSLLIAVRFHDGRYHGEEDGFTESGGWPPSPGRLFQALVAGAAYGGAIPGDDRRALRWLEELPPPRIAAPPCRHAATVPRFVPNNDLDAVNGDPRRTAEIRVGKRWRPRLFASEQPVLYVWDFPERRSHAERVCAIALRLYQLGRGVDMAAATGTVLDRDAAEAVLAAHPGLLRRPAGTGRVSVPRPGTLASLTERHRRGQEQLTEDEHGRTLFRQPPKARLGYVVYDALPRRLHFELRRGGALTPCPLGFAAALVTSLRDEAARKLRDALPLRSAEIERLVLGRDAGSRDLLLRVRIVPLPSIGTGGGAAAIRHVMVEVPAECPLPWRDVAWAFAGIEPCDTATGRRLAGGLASNGVPMLAGRYARTARVFRSVTAIALSTSARTASRQDVQHRRRDEEEAAFAVAQALRHAGVRTRPASIHVQREPLHGQGLRAEAFAGGTRFSSAAMWHATLSFRVPIDSPLPMILGDGRFCGLGLMEPMAARAAVYGFEIAPSRRVRRVDGPALVRALRRALMAVARDVEGRVDPLFSGHEPDGRPDQSASHQHVYLAADGGRSGSTWITRLIVSAPWAGRAIGMPPRRQCELFEDVVHRLEDLRAGRLGRFRLRAEPIGGRDPLVGPARLWRSETEYVTTRHPRRNADPMASVVEDVIADCFRRRLPRPTRVEVLQVSAGPRGGRPRAFLNLHFATAVQGPVMLGRDSHAGGGLFHAQEFC